VKSSGEGRVNGIQRDDSSRLFGMSKEAMTGRKKARTNGLELRLPGLDVSVPSGNVGVLRGGRSS
jgi:hypothetical protein